MAPKVSIITVVFNGLNDLEDTILSVLNQTYSPIEYLIVDGGSTDGTLAIINKYKNKITHFVSEKDQGIYDAMNKAIAFASGEWVNYMNSGDTFYSNDCVSEVFEKNTTTFDFIYGNYIADYHTNGQRLLKATLPQPPHQMILSHQSVFVRTKALKLFPFDTTLRICADLKFYEQCWHHGFKFHFFPHVISVRSHAGLSDINRLQAIKETERVLMMFYEPMHVKITMQRIKLMHLIKSGAKRIMPSFLQRIYRKNL